MLKIKVIMKTGAEVVYDNAMVARIDGLNVFYANGNVFDTENEKIEIL